MELLRCIFNARVLIFLPCNGIIDFIFAQGKLPLEKIYLQVDLKTYNVFRLSVSSISISSNKCCAQYLPRLSEFGLKVISCKHDISKTNLGNLNKQMQE